MCVVGFAATAAMAGPLNDVRIGLHLQDYATKKNCAQGQAGALEFGCDGVGETSNLVVNGSVDYAYDMFVVVLDVPPADGLLGCEMGMTWSVDPCDAYGSTLCSDLVFASAGWPCNGNSATYTWGTCQNTVDPTDPQGEAAVVCEAIYVYAYDPQTTCIDIKPSGFFGATDCNAGSSDLVPNYPVNSGCASFGEGLGYSPCVGGTPVEETTWGAIKSQFGSGE
jgi:hypothetical protein